MNAWSAHIWFIVKSTTATTMSTNSNFSAMPTRHRPCDKVKDDAHANTISLFCCIVHARVRAFVCMCVRVWRDLHFGIIFLFLFFGLVVCGLRIVDTDEMRSICSLHIYIYIDLMIVGNSVFKGI